MKVIDNSEEDGIMKEKILVTRSSIPPLDEYVNEIKGIWETHWLTNHGNLYCELANRLKEYLDVKNISLLVNGHLALELALHAMKLEGEVITTPFTFASTTHAIVRNGLTPVFCDVKESDGTIDEEKIEALITEKTCAILPVHVYGNICNVEKIEQIAKKHNLKVIYDAAHAFGVTYDGKGVGTFGDASMFSFHATKVFNTIEGGAVCYNDEKLGDEIYSYSNFGIRSEEVVDSIGTNAKMNEFQAAMGICNLRHIEEEIAKRKHVVELYRKELESISGISYFAEQQGVKSNYAYFPVIVDENIFGKKRDQIVEELKKENIFVRKYFYPLITDFDCYKKEGYNSDTTPVAKRMGECVMTLPLYADLSDDDVLRICATLRKVGQAN